MSCKCTLAADAFAATAAIIGEGAGGMLKRAPKAYEHGNGWAETAF
jgi:hypothetical protein